MRANPLQRMLVSSRWKTIGVIVLALGLAAAAILLTLNWPFREAAIKGALEEVSGGQVRIGHFQKTFFPHPGCVATDVVMARADASKPPLITLQTLTINGSYGALLVLSKRLSEVDTEGMHLRIQRGKGSTGTGNSVGNTSIGKFVARNMTLEFLPEEAGDKSYILPVHALTLSPASETSAMNFETSLRIPRPDGEVTAKGSFGPWKTGDAFHTPVSGNYHFDHADLGTFHGLGGILESDGKFDGTIASIAVQGSTGVADFEIKGTGHKVRLISDFQANVDGSNGNVRLDGVKSGLLRTEIDSAGTVASSMPAADKLVSLNMTVTGGRIQDLMRLVSSGQPGLNGIVNLRFQVALPAGDQPFLQRLRINGDMGVGDARFTSPATQQGLERISANATPEVVDPADVVSNLKGHVSTANGVATLTGLTFNVPGASANMHGTYQLITHQLDLHGSVQLAEKISQTTTGVKSFLLKALDPIFRKKRQPVISVVPIKITGQAGDISIGLD